MYRKLNIARYILSIVVPIILLMVFGVSTALCAVVLLLFLNNYLDDVVFFFGYRKLYLPKNNGEWLSSPVNGTVTAKEQYVPLYSHLIKRDVLTKEILVEKHGVYVENACKYHHLTVFLNKFNHHIVGNIGGEIAGIKTYDMDGVIAPMVEDGKLIADNNGAYLNNTFVEIVYKNGVRVMLTLDKYISKAVKLGDSLFPMFICKGSQCDIYIPTDYSFLESIDIGDKVEIFEPLANAVFDGDVLPASLPYKGSVANKSISKMVKEIVGITHLRLLLDNFKKTLTSYNLFNIPAIVILLIIYPKAVVPYLLAVLLLFYIDRCFKHLLYSIMNVIGYSDRMTKLYSITHKIFTYGRQS